MGGCILAVLHFAALVLLPQCRASSGAAALSHCSAQRGRQLPSPQDNGRHFPPHQRLRDSPKWREGGVGADKVTLAGPLRKHSLPPPVHLPIPGLDSHICADTAVCAQLFFPPASAYQPLPQQAPPPPAGSASSSTPRFEEEMKRWEFPWPLTRSCSSSLAASAWAAVHGSCTWNQRHAGGVMTSPPPCRGGPALPNAPELSCCSSSVCERLHVVIDGLSGATTVWAPSLWKNSPSPPPSHPPRGGEWGRSSTRVFGVGVV